jgi:hypothetical protein
MGSRDKLTDFFQNELSLASRILIVAVAVALLPSIFLPIWEIGLLAPQYPGGLSVVIYPHTVTGDLAEVNILNHYIGMQEIHADEFPEFMFIPFFILRFLGFAALAALVGRLPIAAIGYLDFVVFGAVMLYRFHNWLYQYGNNLSPDAPLTMEPFTPAMIGSTQIANFTVISYPSAGAILMFAAGALGPVILFWEWFRRRKTMPAE